MPRTKPNHKPVLLNLAPDVLEQIDAAAREQGVTRTQFLRQAGERNLRHYERVERALFMHMQQKGMR